GGLGPGVPVHVRRERAAAPGQRDRAGPARVDRWRRAEPARAADLRRMQGHGHVARPLTRDRTRRAARVGGPAVGGVRVMTELTPQDTAAVGAFDPRDSKVLQYLGLNPGDPKSRAVVAVARRYDLDPLLKHVIVIPKGGVYITRDGLLHIAHRSGQLDGIVLEQEPTLSEDGREWVARVSVYRKDMRHPFTFPGRYPAGTGNVTYAPEMALKAAEAHALRRAFDVTGLPTEDEQRPEQPAQRVR